MNDPRQWLDAVKARADGRRITRADVTNAIPAMADTLTAVLNIHSPELCEPECGHHYLCSACWDDYPCPTVRTITDNLKDTK